MLSSLSPTATDQIMFLSVDGTQLTVGWVAAPTKKFFPSLLGVTPARSCA